MYDVLVVGAGPAGAALAGILAERGMQVLLLDKARFPRSKLCAGAMDSIALSALANLGIDASIVEHGSPADLYVTCNGRYPAHYHFERPLAVTTMRAELDDLIARAAVARGAEFRDGEQVKVARDTGRTLLVETATKSYEARVLVGADGVYSTVARNFGLNQQPMLYVLNEAEVVVDPQVHGAWAGRLHIDYSIWPLGYNWVFPKRTHLSIGTGLPKRAAKQLAVRFAQFRQHLKLSQAEVQSQRSHMIGFRRPGAAIAGDHVLLVGDAAGLADPNTGAGIGWALRSACLASGTIMSYIRGETNSVAGYSKLVDRELMPDLSAARILRNMILLRFIISQGRATGDASLWHQVARIIQGEDSYASWYARSILARSLAWTAHIPF